MRHITHVISFLVAIFVIVCISSVVRTDNVYSGVTNIAAISAVSVNPVESIVNGTSLEFRVGSKSMYVRPSGTIIDGSMKTLPSDFRVTTKELSNGYKFSYNFTLVCVSNCLLRLPISLDANDIVDVNSTSVRTKSIDVDFSDAIEAGWNVSVTKNSEKSGTVSLIKYFNAGSYDVYIDPLVVATGNGLNGGSGSPISYGLQRKLGYANGTIFAFFHNSIPNDAIQFVSSYDGSTFTSNSTLITNNLNQQNNGIYHSVCYNLSSVAVIFRPTAGNYTLNVSKTQGTVLSGGIGHQTSSSSSGGYMVCGILQNNNFLTFGTSGSDKFGFVANSTGTTSTFIFQTNTTGRSDRADIISLNGTDALLFYTTNYFMDSDADGTVFVRRFNVYSGIQSVERAANPPQNATSQFVYNNITGNAYFAIANSTGVYLVNRTGAGIYSTSVISIDGSMFFTSSDSNVYNFTLSIDKSTGTLYFYKVNGTGLYRTNNGGGLFSGLSLYSSRTNPANIQCLDVIINSSNERNTPCMWNENLNVVFDMIDEGTANSTNQSNSTSVIGGGYYGDTTNTAQQYISFFGDESISTEYSRMRSFVPVTGTIDKMYVSKETGGSDVTFKLYKNGVETTLTCTILSAAASCSDLSNSISVSDGDSIALGVSLSSATSTGYFRFSTRLTG